MKVIKPNYISFTKIKYSKERLILKYTDDLEKGQNKHELDSFETPEPELIACFKELAYEVAEICELTDIENIKDRIQVIGVSFSNTNDIRGTVISALLTLRKTNAPLCINTPHKPDEAYSEQGEDHMRIETIAILDTLEEYATRFLQGKRAQIELDLKVKEAG